MEWLFPLGSTAGHSFQQRLFCQGQQMSWIQGLLKCISQNVPACHSSVTICVLVKHLITKVVGLIGKIHNPKSYAHHLQDKQDFWLQDLKSKWTEFQRQINLNALDNVVSARKLEFIIRVLNEPFDIEMHPWNVSEYFLFIWYYWISALQSAPLLLSVSKQQRCD